LIVDKTEFGKMMAYLQAGSGAKPATPIQLEVYWDMLGHLPYEVSIQAARLALAESQYPSIPPVGVLLKLAGAAPLIPKTEDRALMAYAVASRAVQSHGMYRSVDFDDPLINAVIRDMGGWEKFCSCLMEAVQWRKRDFERGYAACLSYGASGEQCAPLTGIIAMNNGGAGHGLPVVHLIECELPPHRPGLIRGELPKRIEAAPETQIVKRLATSLRSADEPAPVKRIENGHDQTGNKWDRSREAKVERARLFAESQEAPIEQATPTESDGSVFVGAAAAGMRGIE
jgi:Domain of unknown function (DUF6475)